jgi:hypothetical protein
MPEDSALLTASSREGGYERWLSRWRKANLAGNVLYFGAGLAAVAICEALSTSGHRLLPAESSLSGYVSQVGRTIGTIILAAMMLYAFAIEFVILESPGPNDTDARNRQGEHAL